MPFNLRAMARQAGRRKGRAVFRPIIPTNALAADLAAVYLEVVREWQAALPRIETEYARTLSQITTDSAADLEREIGQAEAGLQRLFLTLTPRLRQWALRVERWSRGKFVGAALAATGIDLSTLLTAGDVQETVDDAIRWNASLVRNVSDEARARIANTVFTGVRERRPAREVARELREGLGMSRRRSLNIAADQAQKLSARLDQARQEQAGIAKYEWMHSMKRHPRESHVARNGKVFEWAKPPADGHPGTAIRCGCRARAVIDWEDD